MSLGGGVGDFYGGGGGGISVCGRCGSVSVVVAVAIAVVE